MVSYWIHIFAFAGKQTFGFLGKSRGGFIVDIVFVLATAFGLYKKHGWSEMKIKFRETLLEGVLIALACGSVVYVCELFSVPPTLQAESEAQTNHQKVLVNDAERHAFVCGGNLDTQTERASLLVQQRDAQQLTINSDQGQLNSQQGIVSQCVVSLGKMNPIIREKITTILVPIGTVDVTGHIPVKTQGRTSPAIPNRYVTEVFVITNESEGRFQGVIRCDKPFEFIDSPVVLSSAQQ